MNQFFVRRGEDTNSGPGHILESGTNLFTGEKDFLEAFGTLTSMERDLLLIASAIFAADRASKRGEYEDICRNFEINIPVVNVIPFTAVIREIERQLRLLTNDSWSINLRSQFGQQEGKIAHGKKGGNTLLFSGGLDSLAAAIQYGKSRENLQLVSHITRNQVTNICQRALAKILLDAGYRVNHKQFFVSSGDGGPTNLLHSEENSQRTRSFIFLVLGALVARRTGHYDILFIAENGQLAVHLPLTQGRIGALSTHTAHPDFIIGMQNLLSSLLNVPISISNPYVHLTKKEVVEIVVRYLPSAIPITNSCWRNARLSGSVTHCGACVPCILRKIAIESNTEDKTTYARDVWQENIRGLPPMDEARRNIIDLIEFAHRFETQSNEELMNEFPELYSENINAAEVIGMYRRFAMEWKEVSTQYENLAGLL